MAESLRRFALSEHHLKTCQKCHAAKEFVCREGKRLHSHWWRYDTTTGKTRQKTRGCDWCGKRKAMSSQILHPVETKAGRRWLCEDCREPRLPMFKRTAQKGLQF